MDIGSSLPTRKRGAGVGVAGSLSLSPSSASVSSGSVMGGFAELGCLGGHRSRRQGGGSTSGSESAGGDGGANDLPVGEVVGDIVDSLVRLDRVDEELGGNEDSAVAGGDLVLRPGDEVLDVVVRGGGLLARRSETLVENLGE
jgi:hypothetical protein